MDAQGLPVYYHKGTPAMIVKAFDNNIFACINEKVYSLDLIPKHELTSRNFAFSSSVAKPVKRCIPNMTHPWRQANFYKFVNKQKHRYAMDFESAAHSQAKFYALL